MAKKKVETAVINYGIDVKDGEIFLFETFYQLFKEVSGKTFSFRHNYKTGWYAKEVPKDAKLKAVSNVDWTHNGREMPPFTQKELDHFRSLSEVELETIVNKK